MNEGVVLSVLLLLLAGWAVAPSVHFSGGWSAVVFVLWALLETKR